jgi:hypothetical protein
LTVMDVSAESITVAISGQPAMNRLNQKELTARAPRAAMFADTNPRRYIKYLARAHRAKLRKRLHNSALLQAVLGQLAAWLAAVVHHG